MAEALAVSSAPIRRPREPDPLVGGTDLFSNTDVTRNGKPLRGTVPKTFTTKRLNSDRSDPAATADALLLGLYPSAARRASAIVRSSEKARDLAGKTAKIDVIQTGKVVHFSHYFLARVSINREPCAGTKKY